MFGYVVVNKSELKFKEFDQYRRYYCGLCRRLKEHYGRKGQITLSYDMTFLVILLSGLYEPEETKGSRRCLAHPWKKQEYLYNACTDYVADMGILLTYYKCMDDYRDEKKRFRGWYAGRLMKKNGELREKYAGKIQEIEKQLERLHELETADRKPNLDELSDCFGRVLAQIFAMKPDIWRQNLKGIGYYMGKFIYILDAYDDLEQDWKKGCFNPLFAMVEAEGGESPISPKEWEEKAGGWLQDVLRAAIAPAAREFEKMPILKEAGILRNILYSGIWSRYQAVRSRRLIVNDK